MSKEYLEALEKLDHTLCLNNNEGYLKFCVSDIDCQSVGEMVRCLNKVESALHRLESIDNANPSEALECLDLLAKQIELDEDTDYWEIRNAHKTVENALLKAQKEHKDLEIIKKFIWVEDGKLKCGRYADIEIELEEEDFESEEEFDLLKEVLK